MDDFAGARRLVLPQLLSPAECKELEFIHKSCGVVGYRPWVLSTTLCHLVATNCANLILPILPIREKVKEIVEEHFGREYELFTEFTGLISWTKGAKIGWHSDDNRPYLKQRHFSAVCYLNNYEEDFKGGLFHFEEGDPQTVVPSAGTVVIYTADEKNMHCVDEITDGERCTLALWFTLNKAHDEDEKLIQQLSALSSNFCGVMSDQILEQGGLTLGLPVSASSIMYNLNGSVQQDERSDEKSEVAEERPVDDLRLGRMARLGFTCSFSSNYSGDEQDRPVGILYRHEEVPCTFSNMMHALQVIQFHHFRRSIMKLKSSADAEETLAFSKIHDGTNRESLGKENSPLENTHGGTQARRTSEAHLDADIDVRSKRKTNYGREGAQLLEGMANQLDLYFHAYNKGKNTVLVVSKIPLPNYRADLDDRHGSSQRQIRMSSDTENRVENMLAGIREADAHTAASLPKEPENSSVQPTVAPYRLGARKGNQTDLVAPMSMTQIDSEKLNADLREKQRRLQTLPAVKAMSVFREKLPAFKMKEELLRAVANNQVVVVSGETGCGKTTQLPQFLLEQEVEAGRGSKCNIICTQPRRISAMSVAARVAAERGDALGQSVGYQIRLESKRSENTRLLFCTTGVLLRRLVQEPELAGVSHVMVDEIHERGMNEDFLLIILRDLLPRRPDLRLVLMSATINAELFSKYFGNAPMMHIPGFTFPVQELFLEDVLEKTRYRVGADQQPSSNYGGQRRRTQEKKRDPITQAFENADIDAEFRRYSRGTQLSLKAWNGDELDLGLVESTIEHICERESEEGALLVFLTGWDDISKLMEKLKANAALGNASRYLLLPLHGSMPTINQREIFQPPPRGVRKIVLATNIAETSITIDDVVYVIDCGKAKETSYDALNKLACLLPSWISKASAHQRRGRAGRVRAGVCYHLYPKLVYDEMLKFQLPEILRTPLQELCLQIKSLGLGSIGNFLSKALQPPEAMAVQNAIDLLKTIGALDDKEDLTPLGSHLAQLPVDPKVGKMLLMGAVFQCLGPALTIAAALAHRDPFVLPIERKEEADESRRRFAGDTQSDHVALLRAYDSWQAAKREGWEKNFCWTNYLSPPTLQMMEDMRRQFVDLISDIGFVDKRRLQEYNVYSGDMEMVKAVLCAGLFPSVVQCKQRGKRTVFFTKEDGKVEPHPASVNARVNYFPEPWLVYSDKVKTSGIYVRQSTNLSDYALLMFGGSLSPSKEGFGVDMLDGYLQFQAPAKTIQLVQDLRYELDLLLERKVKEPQFDIHKEGKGVVNAVLELLHSGQRKSYSSPSSAWGPDDGDRAQGSSSSSSRPYHGTGFNSRR